MPQRRSAVRPSRVHVRFVAGLALGGAAAFVTGFVGALLSRPPSYGLAGPGAHAPVVAAHGR